MLQILCGPDRTANSMRILDQICENARAGVAGQILIVPEQYSHETERALCARGGDTISRCAEVLSFTRLAARVFSVCGGVCGIKSSCGSDRLPDNFRGGAAKCFPI